MEQIKINTALDSFILLERITGIDENQITGISKERSAESFFLIEVLAQLGALHVRYRTEFRRHAFLLKIEELIIEPVEPEEELETGAYFLEGKLLSSSSRAFQYELEAKLENRAYARGTMLFATVEYGAGFKEEILEQHYRKVFTCLQNDMNRN
ncbi:MAG: hypothetical protein GY754_26655 [bacterium]|nr:hypothetical protein [bacterium]